VTGTRTDNEALDDTPTSWLPLLASALAGILIDLMAHDQHSGSDGSVIRLAREHHVLLSAAVGHLLRTGPGDGVPPQPVRLRNRLRSELRDVLEQQRRRLVIRPRTPTDDGPSLPRRGPLVRLAAQRLVPGPDR
jgi:hypothetical protein